MLKPQCWCWWLLSNDSQIVELGMFLDLPGQSESTNQQISSSSVDWWHQNIQEPPRTPPTHAVAAKTLSSPSESWEWTKQSWCQITTSSTTSSRSELGMFLALPDQFEATNRQNSPRSVDWWPQIGLGGPRTCKIRPQKPKNCSNSA